MIEQLRRGVPENQCPIYLRSRFCSKFSCTRHINNVHLKHWPHRCAACKKRFARRQLLQQHLDSKLNRNCKLFYQDFLEQSNLANHLKENLRRFDGRGLEKLYSVLSRAKITMVTEGVETPEVLAAKTLLVLAASDAE